MQASAVFQAAGHVHQLDREIDSFCRGNGSFFGQDVFFTQNRGFVMDQKRGALGPIFDNRVTDNDLFVWF